MPLAAGTALGPYAVLAFVGAGGMGEIYKARDTRLDRTVAVKILPRSDDPDRRQRFEREARAVSQLQHPHICALFDVGSQDGVEYLVMEFLEGQTLAQRLEKGPLPIAELIQMAIQIAQALDHAHRAAICHRDLKPANIMLTKTGVKLLDFGLARALGTQAIPEDGETATLPLANAPLTGDGVILGTLPYMSPEQLESKPGDARSDIFAFGAVLYEMATGRRAFQGSSGASLIANIMSADPPGILDTQRRDTQPVTPPALEKIVRRCLAKDPENRWQSARDIAAALELVMEQPAASSPVQSEPARRKRLAWGIFAALLIAALSVALTHFLIRPETPDAVTFTIPPPQSSFFAARSTPAVSPDGRRIAFVAVSEGVSRIWIRSLDAMQSRPLAGTEQANNGLFWSPDGTNIAFSANGKLKRVRIDGGTVQPISDAANDRGGSWNQDGVIIFAPTPLSGLFQVPASGGTPSPLTTLDGSRHENSHRWPQFLPDGRRFLYFVRNNDPDQWGIYLGWLDPAKRSERRLILKTRSNVMFVPAAAPNEPGHLLYVQDGTLVAQPFDPDRLQFTGGAVVLAGGISESTPQVAAPFAATSRLLVQGGRFAGSPGQLVWFDRTGNRLSEIGSADSRYSRPELSPDGKRLSVSILDFRTTLWDVWTIDIARGVPTRITFGGPSRSQNAVWSPDGKYLVFTEFRNGKNSVYEKLSDGSQPEELIEGAGAEPCDWSRDGKWILTGQGSEATRSDLWLLPMQPRGALRPLVQTKANEACGQFSPDGKWIAYMSDETGRNQIYVQAFPSGGKWQISQDWGVQARWRGDGKELFYRASDGTIMAVEIRAGTSVEPGIPKALFKVPLNTFETENAINYAVTRDGQKFLVLTDSRSQSTEPMTAVLNWTALLKK